jgi:hypothetical protein
MRPDDERRVGVVAVGLDSDDDQLAGIADEDSTGRGVARRRNVPPTSAVVEFAR